MPHPSQASGELLAGLIAFLVLAVVVINRLPTPKKPTGKKPIGYWWQDKKGVWHPRVWMFEPKERPPLS